MNRAQKIRRTILLASLLFYPLSFFIMSPDLLLFGASERIMAGDVVFFILLFLLAMGIGRLFCGWVCPAGALQDQCVGISGKSAGHKLNWIKMAVFVPWFLSFILLALSAGGLKQVEIGYKRAFGMPLAAAAEWTMYLMTVAIIVLVALLSGKRGFCHILCWVSPFMIIGGKIRDLLRIPSLRLATEPGLCTSCKSCSRDCPMSLPVHELIPGGQINHSECILCLTCVKACKTGAIRLSFAPFHRTANRAKS